MAAEKQYSDAKRVLELIQREALSAGTFLTYGKVARLLGHDVLKYARHVGQVCSLIDAACYWAKLPMLSLEKVRMDNGDYNPDSFQGSLAEAKTRLIQNASAHAWTTEDIKRITHSLDAHMSMEAASLQWQRIVSFGRAGVDRITSYK